MRRILTGLCVSAALLAVPLFAEESTATCSGCNPQGALVEELMKQVEELCSGVEQCEEGPITDPFMCAIDVLHRFREEGTIDERLFIDLLHRLDIRRAFREGQRAGYLAGRASCGGEHLPPPEGDKPDNTDKVTLCHIPPGNPDNRHTISVGSAAVKAHLAHGDTEGACEEEESGDSDDGEKVKGPKEENGNGKGDSSNEKRRKKSESKRKRSKS